MLSALSAVGGFLATLMNSLLRWAAVFLAYLAGKRAADNASLKAQKELLDEYQKVDVRSPVHRDDILDRMRRNGF